MKEKVLLSILMLCFLCRNVHLESASKDVIESFIIHYLEDQKIVPVRIQLNADQQTEHISSIGGKTLYDFKQGKVAYKDLNSNQCFVAEIEGESLERDRRKLRNVQKGIVRGFYLPTFTIEDEFTNDTDLLAKFGIHITEFCKESIVFFVRSQQRTNRRKRDAADEKGQFTHHSYGHYGHQSNNYAHYGHETHITGSVDKDGNVRNHRVSQHQVRSEGSKSFPDPSSNIPQVHGTDSRTGINQQFQTQPASQQSWDSSRPYGTDASGQFSLQTAQESGYQLNLPLGLRAGNTYNGGIRSSGQYSVGGPQPQITTDYQKYPAASPGTYQPSTYQNGQRQISPHIPSIPTRSFIPSDLRQTGLSTAEHTRTNGRGTGLAVGAPGYHHQMRATDGLPSTHETKVRGQHAQPGILIPVQRGGVDHRIQAPGGVLHPQTSDSQTDSRTFIASDGRQTVAGNELSDRRLVDRTIAPSRQVITSRDGQQRIQGTSLHQPVIGEIYPDGQRIIQRSDQPIVQTTGLQPPIDQRITTGGQIIPSRGYQPGTFYPGSEVLVPDYQTGYLPHTKVHPAYLPDIPGQTSLPRQLQPGTTIPGSSSRQIGLSGQVTTGIGGSTEFQTTGIQDPSGISRPGYRIASPYPDSRYQQYIPSGPIPPHYLQTPGVRYPTATNGMTTRSQIPLSLPSSASLDRDDINRRSYPGSASTIPDIIDYTAPATISRYDEVARFYPQYPGLGSPHLGGAIPSGPISPQELPISTSRDTAVRGVLPDDVRYLQPRGTDMVLQGNVRGSQVPSTLRQGEIDQDSSLYPPRVLSTRVSPESTIPRDKTVLTSQIRPGISTFQGRESASSQTQIQTNNDGTAAKASAAGQYRGLGSQTQVQGGYAGNGSFSAQAQSGFTGGVVQSQVQGNSQGGLSGSSSQVEQLGEAQSQVQVGQPSGAASSSAQGRFTGGITQVQAQSGKTGGSAGAQSQSSGLSSSHVQVNIGGKDVSEQDHFQGSVSASVHGGYSSGQSQTQLQGGYDSGRTYVATAQGGFDSNLGFQGSVPPVGALPSFGQSLQTGQAPGFTSGQRTHRGTSGGQLPIPGSPGLLVVPPGSGIIGRTPETSRPANQTASTSRRLQPPSYEQPLNTFVDQRQLQPSSRYPSHLSTTGNIPQQGFTPSAHGARTDRIPGISYPPGTYQVPQSIDSTAQYPALSSKSQQPSYLTPSSQFTDRHPYSTHQTDSTGPSSMRPGTHFPSISPAAPSVTGQRMNGIEIRQPSAFSPGAITPDYQPGLHVGPSYFPGMRQPESPGMLPVSQHPIDQSARVSTGHLAHFQPPLGSRLIPDSEDLLHLGSRDTHGYPYPSSHIPSLPIDQRPRLTRPDYVQQPGFQQGFHYPPQIIPVQPQVSPSRPEILPQQKSSELPILTKPDGSHYIDSRRTIQQPGFYYPSQRIPGQPPRPETSSIVTKPDDSHYIDSLPGTPQQPGEPQVSPPRQQVPYPPGTIRTSRISPSSPATDRARTETPGVSEPDTQNCCAALRDLKRRCCGRTDGKQDGISKSACCKSKTSDFNFDFSSEDDLDVSNGNGDCKVVKAICYIVYKPVGKARVCKPTQTSGC